jgi:thiaminase
MSISNFNTETQKVIKEIAENIKPLLEDIHSKQPTTKNYYGDYMSILAQLGNDNIGKIKLLAIAMLYAGANVNGIEYAVKNVI